MDRATYRKMTQPFRDHPKLAQSLHTANKILTGAVFLSYPLLLTALLRTRSGVCPAVVIPAAGFLLVSAVRRRINRRRPYEKFELPPVIPKDTKGRSFPSRHVFCAAIIASAYLAQPSAQLQAAGGALLVSALLLGAIRVLAGVHYISDVLAALVCAGIGWASFGIWP